VKQFEYDSLVTYIDEETSEDGNRIYTGSDNLPYISTTTFLGKYEDKSGLETWKDKWGHDVAKDIAAESARQGTEAHKLIEDYLFHDIYPHGNVFAELVIRDFYAHIDREAIGVEHALFYKKDNLRVAGRADQIIKIPPNTFKFKGTDEFLDEQFVICDLKTKRGYVPRKDGKGMLVKQLPSFNSTSFLLKNLLQVSMYAATLTLQTNFAERYGAGITGAIVVNVNEKSTRLLHINRVNLNWYWRIFLELLQDYYGEKTLTKTWAKFIELSDRRYDWDTETMIDQLPREIILCGND
jgi:hypothetical protein